MNVEQEPKRPGNSIKKRKYVVTSNVSELQIPKINEATTGGIFSMSTVETKCSFCSGEITHGNPIVVCKNCRTYHHRECWEYNNNKCAVLGCVYNLK